ncbi:aminoglycoside phosphotransferase family protein [Aspergillus lucknowensis]|uniref:Phosphotransferase family protein n=1 Tax=Aspergillus lucknowensis TaxID=176173 RepID=A0ABR4LJ10_9EURO
MGISLVPGILKPDYTWPAPRLMRVQTTTPPVPNVPSKTSRRFWAMIHWALYKFSKWYSSWFGLYLDGSIIQLPFGLIMKWTDRTSVEEYIAMQMARAAGIPVPRALSCGEHVVPENAPNRRISILMTRLPGVEMMNSDDPLEIEDEEPWVFELRDCVTSMRQWEPPSENVICSPIGTALRSTRVPDHIMGPFQDHESFYRHLFAPASSHGFQSAEEYEKTLSIAKRLQDRPYRVKFTHGDFKAHNILVDHDGHLAGFLDWESGGWYPEYWEFTTAMRFGMDSWWYQLADWMGGHEYREELASDKALNNLTVDSYIAF